MSSSPNLDRLVDDLRNLDDPASLYPLAAGFRRAGEATARGDLILVASAVNLLAAELDGAAFGELHWDSVRRIADDLADLAGNGFTAAGLARLGDSWRARAHPPLPN